ncbi:hypothetical protein PV325_010375 [Microctonus aethiopoides]|nr:hypothetical protein PV325_010375 [Microctonus aethiopoides]
MSDQKVLLLCYNHGCGNKFNPDDNHSDACVHHPGHPIFHDAYKGWSCCNKKCTDFTEFLNIKGCTKSFHSNERTPGPQKPDINKPRIDDRIEYRAPINDLPTVIRPPFNTPQVNIVPTVSPALLEQINKLDISSLALQNEFEVQIGQSCKNTSCKAIYRGPESNEEICNYHAGVAIFHEGLKYWSCCQKKVIDFSIFLEQPGCTRGIHSWITTNMKGQDKCRQDWHQTGSFVVVSIYAKKYQPNKSTVTLNPIRLTVAIFFPTENSFYNIDMELCGVIDVEKSSVNMLPTKIEIMLKKAEPGTWAHLDSPHPTANESEKMNPVNNDNKNVIDWIDAVDLKNL